MDALTESLRLGIGPLAEWDEIQVHWQSGMRSISEICNAEARFLHTVNACYENLQTRKSPERQENSERAYVLFFLTWLSKCRRLST